MEPALESRLDQLVRRHGELSDALSAAGLSGADFAKLSKEYSELSPIVDGIEALRRVQEELAAAKEMAGADGDPELKALAEEEMQSLRERLPELELTIKMALLPRDEDDERNAILEVRAGTGGEEAALFAAELFRMYQRYAALRGWRFELSPAATCSPASNTNRACTGCSACRRLRRAAASILRRRPSRCCPKPRRSMSGSRTRICASTCSVRAGRAASRSTPPTARCGSPICRRGSW
jgi:protein subunit release factor A